MKPLAFAISLAALAALPIRAASDDSTSRLMDLARVWVTADYFHPYLAYKNIEWDSALITELPKIREARTKEELADAYNRLLSVLEDKLTVAYVGDKGHLGSGETLTLQRRRFHHGLARDDGSSSIFYSGWATKSVAETPQIRTLELLNGLRVDIRISEPAMDASVMFANRKRAALEETYPSEPARVLAAFRLWGAVHYFYAYKDLIDEDWDNIFAGYITKFVAAKDAREFHLAIAELVSHLSDSNASAQSSALFEYFGRQSPALRARLIEKKPVITQLSEAARTAGAKLGDVITKIDGENGGERIRREANYLSASTPTGLGDAVAKLLLNGAGGSVHLNVARAGGLDAELDVPRTQSAAPVFERPAESAERLLSGGVAYLDVEHLNAENLRAAWRRFGNAPAMIFDLRGPCSLDPFVFTEVFPEGAGRQAAVVTGPIAGEPDLPTPRTETSSSSYFQLLRVPKPAANVPAYRGKVVLLMDERTRGASEMAALLLSAAAHVQTVGSPTAGAPSPATELRLPGSVLVSFSGQDIRLPNGGPIQRQGIQPALTAPVTVAGIRAGRDQPLDVALAWLKEELGSSMVK